MNDGVGRERRAAEVSFVLINAAHKNHGALSEPIRGTERGHGGHPAAPSLTNRSRPSYFSVSEFKWSEIKNKQTQLGNSWLKT